MSEWQPIETAPKDGTEILIYDPRPLQGVNQAVWSAPDGAWVEVVEEYGTFKPTHWMPLPPPPQDASQ